jgi:hypothetical protein
MSNKDQSRQGRLSVAQHAVLGRLNELFSPDRDGREQPRMKSWVLSASHANAHCIAGLKNPPALKDPANTSSGATDNMATMLQTSHRSSTKMGV